MLFYNNNNNNHTGKKANACESCSLKNKTIKIITILTKLVTVLLMKAIVIMIVRSFCYINRTLNAWCQLTDHCNLIMIKCLNLSIAVVVTMVKSVQKCDNLKELSCKKHNQDM